MPALYCKNKPIYVYWFIFEFTYYSVPNFSIALSAMISS